VSQPLQALNRAAQVLGLAPCTTSIEDALRQWTQTYCPRG